jgi:hypothetical protein
MMARVSSLEARVCELEACVSQPAPQFLQKPAEVSSQTGSLWGRCRASTWFRAGVLTSVASSLLALVLYPLIDGSYTDHLGLRSAIAVVGLAIAYFLMAYKYPLRTNVAGVAALLHPVMACVLLGAYEYLAAGQPGFLGDVFLIATVLAVNLLPAFLFTLLFFLAVWLGSRVNGRFRSTVTPRIETHLAGKIISQKRNESGEQYVERLNRWVLAVQGLAPLFALIGTVITTGSTYVAALTRSSAGQHH